jgi:prepilin-type N-terminal cleavage/methylation domain-containing protein
MDRTNHAFTLTELMVALSVFATVSLGLFTFTSVSLRLVGRNLATNHTHSSMRISDQELLYNLHASASPFTLITYNGTTYADATPTSTTDVDAFTQDNISTRSNGVRFRLLAGGPYQLTANTTTASTSLTFNFAVNGSVPYVPEIGDKVALPLLSSCFDITAVTVTPTTGSPTGTVTISTPVGFAINTTTAGNVTTGYFYREVAYTVYNNQLRYHANYTGSNQGKYIIVRDNVTSPNPFSVLYLPGAQTTTALNLRLSLEFYDIDYYSARNYRNGTVTLQAVIPPRAQPPEVSQTNSM